MHTKSETMSKYPILLFDFDGTIASSKRSIFIKIHALCDHFQLQPPSDDTITEALYSGNSILPMLASNMYGSRPSQTQLNTWSDYYESLPNKPELYPHIAKIIPTLATHRTLHIVSNHPSQHTLRFLQMDRINDYFQTILGPKLPAIRPKPSTDMFTIIQSQHPNASLSDFLMIGDTIADMHFATSCGIDIAWAKYGLGDVSHIQAHESFTHTLSSPLDLLNLLPA